MGINDSANDNLTDDTTGQPSLRQSWENEMTHRIEVCPREQAHEQRPTKVIYQVYPSSFADNNGDGIGDIKGIASKLDYIKSLNVDAQWTSPFYPSAPGPEGDGGYAVDNYKDIDPKFGTLEDFKELLKQSHDKELLQYIDFVMCHSSSRHEWFVESKSGKDNPKSDWFVWHDGGVDENGNHIPPNNWKSVFGGDAWAFDDTREQWYLHHFLASQPSLNLNNPKVIDALIDEMRHWTELLADPQHTGNSADGVDGFRLDALPFANHDSEFRNNPWIAGEWPFVAEEWWNQRFEYSMCQDETIEVVAKLRAFLDSYDRHREALGEVIAGPEGGRDSIPVASSYVENDTGLNYCYTNALMGSEGYPNANDMRGTISYIEENFPDGGNCNTVSNHDFKRAWTRWVETLQDNVQDKAYRQLLTLYATIPGSLCIYQGDELGLPQAKLYEDIPEDSFKDPVFFSQGAEASRDGCRTPMPWKHDEKNAGFTTSDDPYLPIPDSHYDLAVDIQDSDPHSTLNFTRQMLEWRASQPALIQGHTIVVENNSNVLAFIRRSKEQTLLCLYNLSDQDQSFTPSKYLGDTLLAEIGVAKDEIIPIQAYGMAMKGQTPSKELSFLLPPDNETRKASNQPKAA